ncbi:alpha/beta fold hydrolase [Sinobaca sp. H24]|uniref:alpha/beta fold hydrolase n=1 Tax=Sinobaca sp. H24 TaxID=2923376 RepID=UPI0020792576|nr:hypothetical protein [Sinobaca sp. H24]
METYRAGLKNAEINETLLKKKLDLRILTIGAPEFFGELVEEQMRHAAENVERAELFEECGHSLALEAEDRLAAVLKEFMLNNNSK